MEMGTRDTNGGFYILDDVCLRSGYIYVAIKRR